MVVDVISRTELALWPHQHAALDTVDKYFASSSVRACLVNMPTGTGKTGVMAAISCQRAYEQAVLVVCPSAALVEQLSSQLKDRFWDKIDAAPEWKPDEVWTILPSNIQKLTEDLDTHNGKRIILVGTVQAIQQVYADGKIEQLHGRIGTILFDEGHREPAPSWARVVRGFSVPTVLFSATPFRGDLKIFDVDDDHIHFLSFSDAVDQGVIRNVEIDEQELPVSIDDYAIELVDRVDELVAKERFSAANKVIVRCDREESVREMHEALNVALAGRNDGVLAIHNNFPDRPNDGILNKVPRNLSEQPERFLIHQFMLIEGIDDPLCTVLALYEPFTNTRMLVQQVGRLIRHPGPIGEPIPKAYVLASKGHNVADDWDSFLTFDNASKKNGNKPYVRNDASVLESLIAALPTLDYVMGRFRERPDLDNPGLHDDLRFPSAAVAFSIGQDLNLDHLQAGIRAELSNNDRHQVLTGQTADGLCRYHVTLRLTPSPFLSGSLFQSPSLEATIYAKKNGRLFFFDSAGLWINELEGIGPRIDELSPIPAAIVVAGKWKQGKPGVSASAFYDVCAQGLKNLAYMKSDGAALPGSQTRFDGYWRLSKPKSDITQTVNRKRHGRGSRAFRKAFQRLRTSPTTDREIWLVCSGGMLSLNKLEVEFKKPQPKPHVLQFYHLVLSTYSACQSVGVRLRIFCAE